MNNPSVESVFVRSWQLLSKNWIIVVPGMAVALIAALINGIFNPPVDPINPVVVAANPLLQLSVGLVLLALAIAQYTYTTGMAGAAWVHGRASLADGTRAFEREAGHMFVAMIGLFAAGVLASLLIIPTVGLSLLALVFFFIYTFPAAVVGERPGLAAMADSYRIALRRPVPTLIMSAVIAVLIACVAFITGLVNFAPLIGPLISFVVLQALGAYLTLVIVGEYLALRSASPPM